MSLGEPKRLSEPLKCPYCDFDEHNALSVVGREETPMPNPGDVSICIKCGNVSIFDNDLKLRLPTSKEFTEMDKSDVIRIALVAWKHLNRQRSKL